MLAKTIERQTHQVFKSLLKSIELCPSDDFKITADARHDSIGKICMHIGGSIKNAFLTPEFRTKWNSPVSSKRECIDYLTSCKDDLLLPFIHNNDLTAPDEQPEFFISRLDRVMKILRHIAHHTGEINCLLRSMGMHGAIFI